MTRPPQPSVPVYWFRRSFRWTTDLDRTSACWVLSISMAIVLALDEVTGPTVTPILGYYFLSCLATWTLREKVGFAVVASDLVLSTLINGVTNMHPIEGLGEVVGPWALVWNSSSRAVTASLLVLLIGTLRHSYDVEHWRATTDQLTGAMNRSEFVRRLNRVVGERPGSASQLLLIYIDLDGFKSVNDDFGHAAGDTVLVRFAAEAQSGLRRSDLFARMGGDEFTALLLLPPRDAAAEVAKVLHTRLTAALATTGYPVGCSMGVLAIRPRSSLDAEHLLIAADQMMYEVKKAGKGSIRLAHVSDGDDLA